MNEILLLAIWQNTEFNPDPELSSPIGVFRSMQAIENYISENFEVLGTKNMKGSHPVYYVNQISPHNFYSDSCTVILIKEVVFYEGN